MPVVEKSCSCQSEYQDSVYGKNVRVFNTCKEGKEARCTVCGKNIRMDGTEVGKKKWWN